MSYLILGCLVGYALISMLLYSITPKRYRYISLLALSVIAYGIVSFKGLAFILASILTFYSSGLLIDYITNKYKVKGLPKQERKALKKKVKSKKKRVVILAVFISVGLLSVLKYFNFFANSTCEILKIFSINCSMPEIELLLPVGISYYTLQGLSYVIDISRGKYKAEKNFLKVALFVSFFPRLNEGPFGRYDDLMPQLLSGENLKQRNVYNGVAELLFGTLKILVVANRAGIVADDVFKNYNTYNGLSIIIGVIAFTVQLYAEFSGYINIARGIGHMYGVEMAKNFDNPFISKDVSEFWRRWHISLGAWFRDYIFYPVSTSKMSMNIMKKCKPSVGNFIVITYSLLIVWFLTGLWHGASNKYIVYGLYYFALMILHNLLQPVFEKLWKSLNIDSDNKYLKVTRIAKTLILVSIGMLMFRAINLSQFADMFGTIFSLKGKTINIIDILKLEDIIIVIIGFIIMLVPTVLEDRFIKIRNWYEQLRGIKKYFICFAALLIIFIFGAYGIGYIPPDPIYGGF